MVIETFVKPYFFHKKLKKAAKHAVMRKKKLELHILNRVF